MMGALSGNTATLGLLGLAALCVAGAIANVALDIAYGRPVSVDPTLQTLATTSIFAVFGQGFFSQHAGAIGAQRTDFVTVLKQQAALIPPLISSPSSTPSASATPEASTSSTSTSSPTSPPATPPPALGVLSSG